MHIFGNDVKKQSENKHIEGYRFFFFHFLRVGNIHEPGLASIRVNKTPYASLL